MVSVRAPRACGNHGAAADFTGEAVLTGMGFVIVFIKFDTISKGLKIGFKKYTIKLLIILKKEVYFLIPA